MEREDLSLKPTLMRLIDFLKQHGITALFTSLTTDTAVPHADSEVGVSSLMDTWLVLGNFENNGERTRTLQVLKSRGMEHSNQVREFKLTRRGVQLIDIYLSGARVLWGTARMTQQAEELAAVRLRELDHARSLRDLASQRAAIDAQIAALGPTIARSFPEDKSGLSTSTAKAKRPSRSSPRRRGSKKGD
jgi:circadian clock protein KaiC